MKYKLPRQQGTPEIYQILFNVIKRQEIDVPKATSKQLKEIAAVGEKIVREGLPNYLICKKLPGKIGSGIFLHPKAKPIEKGQVIAPYAGKVSIIAQNDAGESDYAFSPLADLRLTKEEQLVVDRKRAYHPRRLYAFDLDADKVGNFTRFINHSAKPNIEAHLLQIPKNKLGLEPSPGEIIYIAKKTILPGEQLLVCYEDEEESYWGVLKIVPFPMTARTFKINASLELTGPKQV